MKVAIIGAGVLGRLLSVQLIEQGHDISIYEKDALEAPDNAAYTSAGMLCPLGEIIHAPKVVLEKGWWSLERWQDRLLTIQRLDPEHQEIFFQHEGSLAVAFAQDKSCYAQLQQDFDLKASQYRDDVIDMTADQLHALEPALHQFDRGFHLRTEGQLCNRSFLEATSRILRKHVTVHDQHPVSENDMASLQASHDWVVDCRGSGAIEQPLHSDAKALRGVRGEVLRVYCPDVTLSRPLRVMHPRNSIYIVPKPNNEFIVGATEIESHSEHPITVKSSLELLSTLYCVHPAFAEAQVLETRVGIRTAYADNIPTVTQFDNLVIANGCYRHGWLVGPAIVNDIEQAMGSAE